METQLPLFGGRAIERVIEDPLADAFRRLASHLMPTIVYTAARRRIFSWKRENDETAVILRVGPEFREAPAHVAEAVVRIVSRRRIPAIERKKLLFEIRSWAATREPCGLAAAGRSLPPEGRHVDLRPVLDRVRAGRFRQPIPARIGWTEHPARHLMGRFEKGAPEGLIVINRLLDSPLAPVWYLDFLVYHELLHAVVPPRPGATRILVHPPEFRRAERSHPDHGRARSFERWASGEGFRVLLDPVRSGARLPPKFR